MPPDRASDRSGRFARCAWILLDWGASAFSTVLITLVVAYVERVAFADGCRGVPAGVVWAWTLAAAMLISAAAVPWAAAWADRRHAHRAAVVAATALGAGGLVTLAAVPPAAGAAVVVAIVTACVGFDLAQVFTGALLARIAAGRDADRLSAWGFAAGYAGGAIALIAATSVVAAHERLGLSAAGGLRGAFVVTAAWWLLFTLPAAGARFADGAGARHAASSGRELVDFARDLVRPAAAGFAPGLAGTLLGVMLVLGGVQTAIAQFSSLALERFDLDGPALVWLVLLVQVVALPGAIAVGWFSTRHGRRAAAVVCLAGWAAVLLLALLVETPGQLYGLAVLLALVLGGIQSVLRAIVAALAPAGRSGVTFGLVQVGTKLAGFVASAAFGAAELLAAEPRTGLVALVLQIAAGAWLLLAQRSVDPGSSPRAHTPRL